MGSKVFKPRYSPVLWVLLLIYVAPWFFSIPNAALGRSGADWKLFWVLSGTVWLLAGIQQMREALLKRIVFSKTIAVEMALQQTTVQDIGARVKIRGDTVIFHSQRVQMRYMANAGDLMQIFVELAGMGKMDLVYEEGKGKSGWSTEKNLACLIVFAVYMMAMLYLRLRPLRLIGMATDNFLLGWAAMLPVLLIVKAVSVFRERTRIEEEEKARWG